MRIRLRATGIALLICGIIFHEIQTVSHRDIMASIAGMWASSQISRYVHNRINKSAQRFDKDDLEICTFESKDIEQHDLNNLVQELSDQHLDIRILTRDNVQHAYDDIQNSTTDRVWVIRHGTEPAACLDRNIITIFPYYFFDFTYEEKKAVMRHELQHAIEHHDQKLRSIWAPIYATGALMYALTSSMSIDGTPTHVRHFEMLGRLVSFGIIGCAGSASGLLLSSQWHEISADCAATDDYEHLYSALRSIGEKDEDATCDHGDNWCDWLASKLGPHHEDTERYRYLKHAHAYGQLPWYIICSPAYWLGKPLFAIRHIAYICDTPTDYLIRGLHHSYNAICKKKDDREDLEQENTELLEEPACKIDEGATATATMAESVTCDDT